MQSRNAESGNTESRNAENRNVESKNAENKNAENKNTEGKILVIGSLNVDMVMEVDHFPAAGETIICADMVMVPGGKGANQACAAGKLGADVSMLGAVGNDSCAKLQFSSLNGAGVDTSHILVKKDKPTGTAFITVSRDGDNSIVVVSGANAALTPQDIDGSLELLDSCDMVLLQMEVPLETVCHAARLAKARGKTVILDPAPVPAHFPEELYGSVDVIKPNRTEAAMLTGTGCDSTEGLRGAAKWLHSKGVREVLVTLGGDGVYIDSASCGVSHIPSMKVKVRDTTAAGDTFTGALACGLAQGRNIREAAEFAGIVSSIAVTRKGAQTSMPTLEEVKAYMGSKRAGQARMSGDRAPDEWKGAQTLMPAPEEMKAYMERKRA